MYRISRLSFGLLAVALVLAYSDQCVAQTERTTSVPPPEPSKSTFGIVLDASLNEHRANFQTLPDIPNCCPLFQNGLGLGGEFGLSYDYDAFGEGHLGIRALVELLGGTLKTTEPALISNNGIGEELSLQHTIGSHFSVAALEPYYALSLGNLRLMAGPSIGYIFHSTYDQAETIVSPDNAVFYPSESRSRNVYSGNIPDAATTRIGIFAGASYSLPMNSSGSLHLIPEITYDYGVSQLVSGLSWSVSALRGGVTIGYTPIHYFEPPPPPPPPPPPAPRLAASIEAYSVTDGVRDSTNLSVRVEEFYTSTTTPLLPFILFGLDDAKIPARYHDLTSGQASDFDIHKTDSTDNVHVYHDILNIIGKRMLEHPKARLTLTGCTSNEPEELADSSLALRRADAVAVYLEKVWNIDPKRLTLEKRGLPGKPSSLTQQEGKEENRRVEIVATDPAILNVVTLGDTDLSTNPPMMQFVPTVSAQAGVKFWDLYVTQAVQILHHEFGRGTQPEGWDWDLHSSAAYIPRTEDTIEYGLRIVDSAGQQVTTTGMIPVRQVTISKKRQERISDKVIERYTLVLFDFGSSKIDPQNERAIEYIKQQITPGTRVEINGYADRTGEVDYDQKLTEDRANAVASMLNAPNMTAKGYGKSVLLYDNDIPEGRFYSRTVNIVLYKPVNQVP